MLGCISANEERNVYMTIFDHPLYKQDLQQISNYIPDISTVKSVLVTGATGLIGSLVVDAFLYKNHGTKIPYKIYGLGRSLDRLKRRFKYASSDKNIYLFEHDITKPLDCPVDFDYIIHAASNADPKSYASFPAETITTNIIGTYNILEYARKHNSVKIIFTSTMEVYGTMPSGTIIKESDYGQTDFNQIRSGYPESKRVSELLFRSYSLEHNIFSIIARLGYIYGPSMTQYDSKAAAQFINNAVDGMDIILKSPGIQRRSYCYSADAVSGILSLLFKGQMGEAYNVANNASTITIVELAESVAKIAGTQVVYSNPEAIEKQGYSKQNDAVLDEGKLRSIGWMPQYTIKEGMDRTIKILKDINNIE